MKSTPWIPALLVAIIFSGCGEIYHLPGHKASNSLCPPPVTMTQGESRRILTTGMERFFIALPPGVHLRSSDPKVAEIGGTSWTAYLTANAPGKARVHYNIGDPSPENPGFEVTVLPAKP
jgi:hypothetical protein